MQSHSRNWTVERQGLRKSAGPGSDSEAVEGTGHSPSHSGFPLLTHLRSLTIVAAPAQGTLAWRSVVSDPLRGPRPTLFTTLLVVHIEFGDPALCLGNIKGKLGTFIDTF